MKWHLDKDKDQDKDQVRERGDKAEAKVRVRVWEEVAGAEQPVAGRVQGQAETVSARPAAKKLPIRQECPAIP